MKHLTSVRKLAVTPAVQGSPDKSGKARMVRFMTLAVALFVLYLMSPSARLQAQSCWPAWSSSAVYTAGNQASYNGENYQAAYWTQNQVPSSNSGPAGSGQPWIPEGSCSGGSGSGSSGSGSGSGTNVAAPTQCGTLLAGQGLMNGQTLTSCDARFTLSEQTDGNLVLYMGGSALWASGTNGQGAAYVIMQSDGNLVQYNSSGGAVWASGTYGNSGAYTYVQNDGNLVIYTSSYQAIWASNTWGHTVSGPTQCGQMTAGQGLASGTSISSCDGQYTLSMQSDGNLVLYHGSSALWATGTNGKGGYEAVMQADGNFVLYSLTNALWASGTWGNPGSYLAVQTDGNLVVYNSSNGPIWASGTCSGCGGSGGTGGTGGTSGGKLFAPYIDISLSTDENPSGIASSAGLHAITLAFLTAGGCSTGWGGLGGTLPTDNFPNGDTVSDQVGKLQGEGVTVIISTGGASGTDPAAFCGSASALQGVYQQVINQYHINRLDFDIEGGAQDNHTENAIRAQALNGLRGANSGLTISFTLPVLNSGLTSDGLTPINDSAANGFSPDIVNVMAMDYGSCCDNGGAMDVAAENAAANTHNQVNKTIGITPMIGQNDTGGEIFTLQDASNVVGWANGQSYVGLMAFWSLARDNGGCPGQTWASATCSGVSQNTYQFSQIFEGF